MATAIDVLQVANWQRANAGKKSGRSPRPKPLLRPGVGPKKVRTGGTTRVPLSEARRIFEAHNPAAF